jgi:hypothetical protein
VRGGKAAIVDASACQKGRREATDGPLAIGAGDVYGLPRELDIFEELANALETRLDHDGCRSNMEGCRQGVGVF